MSSESLPRLSVRPGPAGSGSGESTLAASIADERQTNGDVVLFYRAASLVDGDL